MPPCRGDLVSRTGLVNRLRAARATPLATVIAPAGYGKTTLLAQWAGRERRPVAWVSLDKGHNDPVVLLRYLAVAIDRIGPLDARVLSSLCASHRSEQAAALARLASALSSFPRPFGLVLDDADVLDSDSAQAISVLLEYVPKGSLVVLVGRRRPKLRLERLAADRTLLRFGPDDLALSPSEVEQILRAAGLRPSATEASDLARRTEGWPAALRLATLSFRSDSVSGGRSRFAGDDRDLVDYIRSECLTGLSQKKLSFLRRTSVLERMSGTLCDAVLETSGSSLRLESLERAGLPLIALDARREWYRYNRLFREALQHELELYEPEQLPKLHGRAAAWYEAHDQLESALEHSLSAGEDARSVRLLCSSVLPLYESGRAASATRSLANFAENTPLERHPTLAAHGALLHALLGQHEPGKRYLTAAERGSRNKAHSPNGKLHAYIATARAALCPEGPARMLADAEDALAHLTQGALWRAHALLVAASAELLLGNTHRADSILAETAELAQRLGATSTRALALSQHAIVAAALGDHSRAETLALDARELIDAVQLQALPASALTFAVSARVLLRQRRISEARIALASGSELTNSLAQTPHWLLLPTRLELAHAAVSLLDAATTRSQLDEIDALLRQQPGLDILAHEASKLRCELDNMTLTLANQAGLTPAELRLLPLLATHLTFRELGGRLYVSRNTVKTQAISIYRKLGASSRSEVVKLAVQRGLLDAPEHAPPRLTD